MKMKKFNYSEEFSSEALQNVVGGKGLENFSMTWSAKACADKCEMCSSKDHDSDFSSSVEF